MAQDDPAGRREVSAGTIAADYLRLLGAHWRVLLLVGTLGAGASAITGYFQDDVLGVQPADFMTFFDLDLLPVAFITAASAHATLWGRPGASLTECLDVAARAFLPVLAVTVLARLAVVIGFVLLLLPGFAAMVLLAISAVIMMAERPGILPSLTLSVVRIWPSFFKVLLAYILFLLSLLPIAFVAAFAAGMLGLGLSEMLRQHVQDGAISAAFSVSHTVFAVSVYRNLEARQVPTGA